jgi:uncharacterized membrane protein
LSESAKQLLDAAGQKIVVKAIQTAEAATSGEIRVHLEDYSRGDALARARFLFNKLGMHQTIARNGVLIYIAVKDHQVAVYGDEGIHAAVGVDFWQSEIDLMVRHFKQNAYAEGISQAVLLVGQKLQEHFPHQGKNDQNELNDEISFG